MAESLSTSRLEAFSDGVIAVIITIMVLELKVPPPGVMSDHAALLENLKVGSIYLLSFTQVGIYWVNHHYLLDDLETVSHGVLWANLVNLFALSFIPIGLQWIGTRGIRPVPVAVYCCCFLFPALTWSVLANTIRRRSGVAPAAGAIKQTYSCVVNIIAIFMAFVAPWASLLLITTVLIAWLVPPRRIREKSRAMRERHSRTAHSS